MDTVSLIVTIIGALNLGVAGLFGVDLLASIFGGATAAATRVAYTLVGLGGLWCITLLFRETEHAPLGDIPNKSY